MIVEQRQIQCIVWDGGGKQILICQTEREKSSMVQLSASFALLKVQDSVYSNRIICLIPTPIHYDL